MDRPVAGVHQKKGDQNERVGGRSQMKLRRKESKMEEVCWVSILPLCNATLLAYYAGHLTPAVSV